MSISKISENLYLGPASHPISETDEFKALKCNTVINCAKEVEMTNESVKKFGLEDDQYATLLEYIDDASEYLADCIRKRRKIYICCSDGDSRAPAILIYYMMAYKDYSFDDAHNILKKIRHSIDLNLNFINELRIIEENSRYIYD